MSKNNIRLYLCKKRFWMKEGGKSVEVSFEAGKVYEAERQEEVWIFTSNEQGEEHTLEHADMQEHFELAEASIFFWNLLNLNMLSNLSIKLSDSDGAAAGPIHLDEHTITALEFFLKRYKKFVEEHCGGTYTNDSD